MAISATENTEASFWGDLPALIHHHAKLVESALHYLSESDTPHLLPEIRLAVLFTAVNHMFILRDQLAGHALSISLHFVTLNTHKPIKHLPTHAQILALLNSHNSNWQALDSELAHILARLSDEALALAPLTQTRELWQRYGIIAPETTSIHTLHNLPFTDTATLLQALNRCWTLLTPVLPH